MKKEDITFAIFMSSIIFITIVIILIGAICDHRYNRKISIDNIIRELQNKLNFINKEIEENSSNLVYFKELQKSHAKILKKLNQAKIDKLNYSERS